MILFSRMDKPNTCVIGRAVVTRSFAASCGGAAGKTMPVKIRELIAALKAAGFVQRGGKGSHRNFTHPCGAKITVSGNLGDDAKPYQEREVRKKTDGARS